ncbi:H-NS family histone-like protein [Rheinheimera salexigens]|uniref:H-NS histone family protein n=1 Tax=Rheinheimera salexigens TaxID=1628148 RepID=A0A1E7Q8C8_9GAMM|nr:H-NS histone family protein [Rheinheimera salexigens]OEY70396.1 H-NS histone family protein [Rheinheimera salexigens]
MSLLLEKRELKKAAKELTLVKLTEVIEVLNAVLAERQTEVELIEQLETLAKSQGFTLEQLGYKQSTDVLPTEVGAAKTKAEKRPVKPKFKTINKESQYFYVEDGQLQLLRTHTMKKGLQARGINVLPVAEVDKKYSSQIDRLIADATEQAVKNFNNKVDSWNEWAQVNGGEILTKK